MKQERPDWGTSLFNLAVVGGLLLGAAALGVTGFLIAAIIGDAFMPQFGEEYQGFGIVIVGAALGFALGAFIGAKLPHYWHDRPRDTSLAALLVLLAPLVVWTVVNIVY